MISTTTPSAPESVLPENVFNVTTPAGQPYEHAFKWQKNAIPIGCVLHSWMRAYVIVRNIPIMRSRTSRVSSASTMYPPASTH